MKNLFHAAFIAALVLGFDAHADASSLVVACGDVIAGNEVKANFDSKEPFLTSSIRIEGDSEVSSTTYLSATGACGVSMDFLKQCKGEVRSHQGDRGYFFECKNGVAGEVIFFGDAVSFSCSGPGVASDYQDAFFFGCKVAG